ncbi:MAG: hypothetical protein E6Q97_07170 [Desulfurellales bacterium]|nr:MAG: hypothetical protein E6Q97_07170 [Desulfurellales bacterium]
MPPKRDLAFTRTGYVGLGHKPKTRTPPIVELPMDWRSSQLLEKGTRRFKMGQCNILVSPPYENVGWHLSISHPTRYPTWDEIAAARYECLPTDRDFVMVLPKPEDYISIHENCFQLWEDGKDRA